jgi:hypothetical protein
VALHKGALDGFELCPQMRAFGTQGVLRAMTLDFRLVEYSRCYRRQGLCGDILKKVVVHDPLPNMPASHQRFA